MKKYHCENCKHYIQHYSYSKNYRLSVLGCGHCLLGEKKCAPGYLCNNFAKGKTNYLTQKEIDTLNILHNIQLYFRLLEKLNKEH